MLERNKLGIVLFLGSEIGFFGVLILSYLYYYGAYADGHNAVTALDPLLVGLFTICLLVSSFTLWHAQKSIDRDSRASLNVWLLPTVTLGTIFVFGQAWEYTELLSDNVTISSSLFATTFFTLTGMHGLHVLGGLIALLVLLGLALRGQLNHSRSTAVATVELYWHFVDVVWIAIFAIVYLWPRL